MHRALLGLLVGMCFGPAFAQGAEPPLQQSGPPALAQPPAGSAAGSSEATTALSRGDLQELLVAARETAKAAREGVDYNRVVPDLLVQILAKLDKIENKLDKIEARPLSAGRKNAR